MRSAALAAELLENACDPGTSAPLRLEVVRMLARDLKRELEVLASLSDEETGGTCIEGVEGALRAADVANLAACTVPELPKARAPEGVAATHLAAGTVQALHALAEGTRERHTPYALKDFRAALWRARLAARQVEEFLEEAG